MEDKREEVLKEIDKGEELSDGINEEVIDTSTEEDRLEEVAKEAAKVASILEEEERKEETEREEKDSKLAKIEELNDKLIRNMAEFDNFRKRTEKEKQAMFDMGAKNIVDKLLPIIDNFERGLKNPPVDGEAKMFFDGMDMIYKQLIKNLEEAGVSPIECIGKEFDPNFHNAVMHIEDENVGENIIIEELQKGYMYKDSVLRYSMVKVAN